MSEAPEAGNGAPDPEAHAAGQELLDALVAALDALPEEAREVILLRDVEGLTAAETASVVEISPEAVKSRLHRARTALREQLRPLLEPAAPAPGADCPNIMALWSQKLEGELSQLDCAQMEAHLAGCPSCGAACATLKRELDLCRRAAALAVPPEIQARVKSALRAWVES